MFQCHVAWLLWQQNSVTTLLPLNQKFIENNVLGIFVVSFINFKTQSFFFLNA